MKSFFLVGFILFLFIRLGQAQSVEEKVIPEALEAWKDWATWNDISASVPSVYNDRSQKASVWPSALNLDVNATAGLFSLDLTVYRDTWVDLPGDREVWPLSVRVNGEPIAVMAKENRPSVLLKPGQWKISGTFQWSEMPQFLLLPTNIGILNLKREGIAVQLPSWNESGKLWLKRTTTQAADKNFLSTQVYRNLKDGLPMWLYTEVELTVAGKSREEELGVILPKGWQISSVESPIPCAVDDEGLMKAQVRAGKWTIAIAAFRTTPAEVITYKSGVKPVAEEELISLQNEAGFRLIEFINIPAVDVAQTTFPDKWRNLPLYQWETSQAFEVVEKMRGMGQKKPPGLTMKREFWLDENGKQLTYRDEIKGRSLETWRLDSAEGQKLGAAKIDGKSQLITLNPKSGAEGVEVRVRNLSLQAVGRMDRQNQFSATGWQSSAEELNGELYLPPGWRLFAIFGPDWSSGDWLTSWSLLDIFFLLIFTVAIFRLWGWKLGTLACLTFALSYHEPQAPRLTWVLLIAVLALYRSLSTERWRRVGKMAVYSVAIFLLIGLIPFVSQQLQQMLYPQLESHSVVGTYKYDSDYQGSVDLESVSFSRSSRAPSESKSWSKKEIKKMQNLTYDRKAKIQTGPAVPEWSWRSISFGWSGPVSANEKVSLVLIPLWVQRILIGLRVTLLLALLYLLIRGFSHRANHPGSKTKKKPFPVLPKASTTSLFLVVLGALAFAPQVRAEFPDATMLAELRQRIIEDKEELAQYAEMPQVEVKLEGRKLSMDIEVHVAKKVAVPLPGRLPAWSPVSVLVNGDTKAPLSRSAGYLWVVLDPGTHRVKVNGLVPAGDWEWSFLLKPQYVNISAPGWAFTGVKPNGSPEDQVFFAEQNRSVGAEVAYDRKDFNPILKVSRSLELGLVWQAQTTVRRLSPLGKAISISLPVLPGERIFSPGFNEENGRIEIRFGSQDSEITWESELTPSPELRLSAEKNNRWVEEWRVVASSIWNLELSGLSPVFENKRTDLAPFWRPWPGESVLLRASRPEAVVGDTMTIRQSIHKMNLGSRQRSSSLALEVQTSLGSDFIISLAPEAEVSSLKLGGVETPVRKDGNRVIIPLRPGAQKIELGWKTPYSLTTKTQGDLVKLPVDCANASTIISLSNSNRWVLWADGPRRGPAVRMWSLLLVVLISGWLLGFVPNSPLRSYEWILLLIGLTQLPFTAVFFVVGWMFWLSLRGRYGHEKLPRHVFNLNQILIILGVIPVVVMLLAVLHKGLLGGPEMRIIGESSSGGRLVWFQARGEGSILPVPTVISVSIWFYRGLMLIWAVWLAFSVLRWVQWGWSQLGQGGFVKRKPIIKKRMPKDHE